MFDVLRENGACSIEARTSEEFLETNDLAEIRGLLTLLLLNQDNGLAQVNSSRHLISHFVFKLVRRR